jgi:hypothetical protein
VRPSFLLFLPHFLLIIELTLLSGRTDDDDIECIVNIAPIGSFAEPSHSLPDALLPETVTDDQEKLEKARKALSESGHKDVAELALQLEQRAVEGGIEGVPVASLSVRLPFLSPSSLRD